MVSVFSKEDNILLADLYTTYRETIKPLLATYEVREEEFPSPVYNEIRAFNDHIAKCYMNDISPENISEEIKMSKRHIKRIVYDLFKFLIYSIDKSIVLFEKQTKNIDITIINNGDFFHKYKCLRKKSTLATKLAKSTEARSEVSDRVNELAFIKFEEAYNTYSELEDWIDEHISEIVSVRRRFRVKRYSWIIPLVLSAIVSAIIGGVFSCDWLKNIIEKMF